MVMRALLILFHVWNLGQLSGSAARDISCDIVVAGGSTASLAAAITAAEAAPEIIVCFTEVTDWPGGQMTAGGVPAIDFGGANTQPENQPASFRDAMAAIPGDGRRHTSTEGSGSPGACSVSTKCYRPDFFVNEWVTPRLARSPNLQVFLRTAVIATQRASNGSITSLTAVQRTPRGSEWSTRLSQDLPDWYSTTNSTRFGKETLVFSGQVFLEATELGDVLVTANAPWMQGLETPFENSTSVNPNCGQAATLTFYAELLASPAPAPSPAAPALPHGNDAGEPFHLLDLAGFEHTWSWRRAECAGNRSLSAVNVGDITQQNLGNDLDTAYLLLPPDVVRSQVETGSWSGGVNLTALRMLEDRAYGWFGVLKNSSRQLYGNDFPDRLIMNRTTSGTLHGLSKMVYWRDTRRAVGVKGYKLLHTQLRDTAGPTGMHFYDTVALGDYNDDTHHLHMCQYPSYLSGAGEGGKPYYIPFRALQVDMAPNLLVAGKLMSETFHANSNTRLHPSEWTSGVAAGGAAVLMIRNHWKSTNSALEHITELQAFLNSSVIGQPLDWTGLVDDSPVGSTCALARCLIVDAKAAAVSPHPVFRNSTTCHSQCKPLEPYEWLANQAYWTRNSSVGDYIYSTAATVLKKATALSGVLPPEQLYRVQPGTPCILANASQFAGYWLCVHHVDSRQAP